ncbi:SdrD B-like domain-containing protein [Patulibacter sp. NPDC049589]|uniref:SdrD B-like domain-containing protein n=1 Tax=Patulibacter sp. NPDC049589 TaxID=3154731 RepID=UPI003434CAA2
MTHDGTTPAAQQHAGSLGRSLGLALALIVGATAVIAPPAGAAGPSVSVGDVVWRDIDGDGIQDAGEPGIAGVQLTLRGPGGSTVTDTDGVPVGAASTGGSGAYAFSNLPVLAPGESYTVIVDRGQQPLGGDGLAPTRAGVGQDRARDSSTGSADSGDLTTDKAVDSRLDFGFVPAVSVGDLVWRDVDGDGIQGPGEPGIEGVRLTITGPSGGAVTDVAGRPVGPATTDAAGRYAFGDLPALGGGAKYTVRVDGGQAALGGAGLAPTRAGAGTDRAADSSTASAASGDLTSGGARDLTLDFGFVPVVSVGDFVWRDQDGDGLQSPGEPGIRNVRLTITGPDGQPVTSASGATVGPATTDQRGRYAFGNLPALPPGRSYTVRVDGTQPALAGAQLAPTRADVGDDPALDSSTESATARDLTIPGDTDPTLDFGFSPAVAVGDVVWRDQDGDGLQSPGEPGVPGVVLTLTGPDGGPVTDALGRVVPPTTTDGRGRYGFGILPPLRAGRHYAVHVDGAQPALAGLLPTASGVGADPRKDSSTGSAVSGDLTASGDADLTLDFGFAPVALPAPLPDPPPKGPPVLDPPPPPRPAKLRKVVLTHRAGVPVLSRGARTRLTITATNRNAVALPGVRICERLPKGLVLVTAVPKAVVRSGRICWPRRTLGAGRTRTVRVTVRGRALARSRHETATATAEGGGVPAARVRRGVRVRASSGG